MKLLFDQNVSHRLVAQVSPLFRGSSQVRFLQLEDASDFEIWKYARENDFAVVTFNRDFINLSVLHGLPPKVIWLRLGSVKVDELAAVLAAHMEGIDEFLHDGALQEVAVLEIGYGKAP